MLRGIGWALLLIGMAMSVPVSVEAAPIAPERRPGVSSVIPVQDARERCRWLRHDMRRLESRIAYAQPWERPRMERRLRERRREFRHNCRW